MKTDVNSRSGPLCIEIDGLRLFAGSHWIEVGRGMALLKPGLLEIRNYLGMAQDPPEAVEKVLEKILQEPDWIEETFESPHWRSSLFRGIPRKLLGEIPRSFKDRLSVYLMDPQPFLARRSAKILARLYPQVGSYPDLTTLLHGYFLTRNLSPRKLGHYVRDRLLAAHGRPGKEAEYLSIRNELEAFAVGFRQRLAIAGLGEVEFTASIEVLAATIDRQRDRVAERAGPSTENFELPQSVPPSLTPVLHDYFRAGGGNFRKFDRCLKRRFEATGTPVAAIREYRKIQEEIRAFVAGFASTPEPLLSAGIPDALEVLEKRLALQRDRRMEYFEQNNALLIGGDEDSPAMPRNDRAPDSTDLNPHRL